MKAKFKKFFIIFVVNLFLFPVLGLFNHVNAAASLYLTASTTSVYLGNTFTVYPRVNTGGAATNAYSVNIVFPSTLVQPISISKGGSICTLYTQEPSYTASTATISCGLPTPGYNGSSGGLGSITFRAKAKGAATISIVGSSKVLANDGLGTNILGSTGSVTVNITDPPPPPIAAPTVTCSVGTDGEWLNVKEVTFSWTVPSGANGFSYTLTQNQGVGAGRTNMGGGTSKTYSDLADGTYYFKIAATNGSQWSNDTTYTLRIDTTPPKDLEIVSEPSNDKPIDKLPMISFNAVDEASGMDHYEIKIDDGEYIVTENPYQIEEISSGEHTITVKAVDVAGNYIEGSITITIAEVPSPVITKPKNGAYIPIGEKVVIEGTSTPNSIVYIYLNGELIAEVIADEDGNFSFTYDQVLLQGTYEVYAVTKSEGGILSPKSETVTFKIDSYAVRIGSWVIPSFCVAILLLLLLILFILLIVYIYKRFRDYRRRVREGIRKAQKSVDKEFEELEKDMKEGVGGKGQMLSRKKERKLEKDLAKEILEAEKDVKRAFGKVPFDGVKESKPKKSKLKDLIVETKSFMRRIGGIVSKKRKSKKK